MNVCYESILDSKEIKILSWLCLNSIQIAIGKLIDPIECDDVIKSSSLPTFDFVNLLFFPFLRYHLTHQTRTCLLWLHHCSHRITWVKSINADFKSINDNVFIHFLFLLVTKSHWDGEFVDTIHGYHSYELDAIEKHFLPTLSGEIIIGT